MQGIKNIDDALIGGVLISVDGHEQVGLGGSAAFAQMKKSMMTNTTSIIGAI